jgi:hypothetical protein
MLLRLSRLPQRALARYRGLYVPGNRHEKAAIMKRAPRRPDRS